MARKNKKRDKENKMRVFASWRHNEQYKSKNNKINSFVALPHTLLMNENFIRLKQTTKVIYIYMTDYANGLQSFTFPKSIYEKITTKQTFQNAKDELEKLGFIEVVGFGKNTRTENEYKFIDKWKTIKLPEKEKRKTHINDKYTK